MVLIELVLTRDELEECKNSRFPYEIKIQLWILYYVVADVPQEIVDKIEEDRKNG